MTWWGVRLDGVALINLIMCIGFSVDFSAHICYHYLTEEGKRPSERIRASLYALGLPIIQVSHHFTKKNYTLISKETIVERIRTLNVLNDSYIQE